MSKARTHAAPYRILPGRRFTGKRFCVGTKVRAIVDGAEGEIIELGTVAGEKGARIRWISVPVITGNDLIPDLRRTWATLRSLRVVRP
jgi:hypothetical protein